MMCWLTVLVGLWLVTGRTVQVQAATIFDNGDFVFQVMEDGKSAEIIEYNGKSLYVSVPPMVDKYKVTKIGAAAFMSNKTIKELEIPGSVEYIDANAFMGCQALKKADISGNVETIGEGAFMNCPALETLILQEGIMHIRESAFSGCTALRSVELPNSVITVEKYAFFNCSLLEDIVIPDTIDELGGYALEGTKWMKNQTTDCITIADGILIKYTGKETSKSLPSRVKRIGDYAFAGHKELETLLLSRNVTKVGKYAFSQCGKLTTVSLPETVVSIGEGAFEGCAVLNNVTLPSQLKTLEKRTFADCEALTAITVPAKVESIGEYAFSFCTELKNVKLQEGIRSIQPHAFQSCLSIGRMIFPASLREIAENAFANCSNITRIEFNGDTGLASFSFSDCFYMKEAVFYKNPTNINEYAFSGNSLLTFYSDSSLYVEEFARKTKLHSDNIKNLPPYEDKEVVFDTLEQTEDGFSGTYTFIIFIIVVVDIAVIVVFGVYIWTDQRRVMKKRKADNKSRRTATVPKTKAEMPLGTSQPNPNAYMYSRQRPQTPSPLKPPAAPSRSSAQMYSRPHQQPSRPQQQSSRPQQQPSRPQQQPSRSSEGQYSYRNGQHTNYDLYQNRRKKSSDDSTGSK